MLRCEEAAMPGKTNSLNARDMQTKGQLGSTTGISAAQLPLCSTDLVEPQEMQGHTWAGGQHSC